jgi:hypothetical protein
MKVIFLDIDGVLNSQVWMMTQPPTTNFLRAVDPSAVKLLYDLISRSGAVIVVSSTWRILNSLSNIRSILIEAGYPSPCPIIGKTPRLAGTVTRPFDGHKIGDRLVRGHEIQNWLEKQPAGSVESFVILDDDSDMAHLMPKLVNTSFETGLQPEHVERALIMLGINE